MEPILILLGVNGQVELYDDQIIIKRKGFISKMSQGLFKGDKTIYLRQITAVQVKKGGIANGYIQFTLGGGHESRKGLFDATKDENSVIFTYKQNELVAIMKAKIEELLKEQYSGGGVKLSGADEIKKYKELLDAGIISQEEFDKKKTALLK